MGLSILDEDICKKILLEPYLDNSADTLNILSGYGSPSATLRHLKDLNIGIDNFNLSLIVGMAGSGAINSVNHRLFNELTLKYYPGIFTCKYLSVDNQNHAKIYLWKKNGCPVRAWCTSANYSQSALYLFRQSEVCIECDPSEANTIFQLSDQNGVSCESDLADEMVVESDQYNLYTQRRLKKTPQVEWSLLSSRTDDGLRYGLNWGQRPNRSPDQVYIPVPSEVYNTDFFPDRAIYFSIETDDDQSMVCVRQQDNGKAISTPHDNSLLGRWFKKRIGIAGGDVVTVQALEQAQATHVAFEKINDEEYKLSLKQGKY